MRTQAARRTYFYWVIFPVLLVTGLLGLVAVWLLGLVQHSADHHGHHHHSVAAARVSHHVAGVDPDAAPLALTPHERAGRTWFARALPLLSPLFWFGLLFGAGAAGTVAWLLGAPTWVSWSMASAGAVAFQIGVLGPISRAVFHFASRPAENLEGQVFQEVRAVTRFNRRGEGLVRVTIDGRTEDVLATLADADRRKPGRVDRGDRLLIEEIDSRNHRCVVSRR